MVAHRGAHCCGHEENSLPAIEHAVELHAPGIEVDVCNLGDGELVLSHDPYVPIDGVAVPLPALRTHDLAPLLRTGRIALARCGLDLVRAADAFLCLDWKGFGDESGVVRLIDEFRLRDRTIVSSSHSGAVARIKEERPGLVTGLSFPALGRCDDQSLLERAQRVAGRVRAAGADAAMLELSLASEAMLGLLRERAAGVFLWTAKKTDAFSTLAGLTPDGIMSDAVEDHLAAFLSPSGR